jgi:hypothetical protein
MTDHDSLPPAPPPAPEPSTRLRLRIWMGCLAGALVSSAGIWWVAGTQLGPGADPARVLGWLVGLGGLGLVVGGGFALWLDRGVVTHLRGVARSLASGRVQELRGLPGASGWGELSELTDQVQHLITRQRAMGEAVAELERLESQLATLTARIEQWRFRERWEPLAFGGGAADALARELDQALSRHGEVAEQNLEASRRVRSELVAASEDARESAEMAERGFVEATALLTTVRELQRLGVELRGALGELEVPVVHPDEDRLGSYREAVADALERLIDAANASVEHLGAALLRVQEIASQVQLVSNRATLVALHAVTLESRLPQEARGGEDLSRELRQLTADVREASQRADELAAEVERQTRAAGERMRSLREHVASHLETLPAAATSGERARVGVPEPAARLLERVREMIQDATQKGERLSAAGERASRAADRLLRRLEDDTREVEGLMVRLAPGGELPETARGPEAIEDEAAPAGRLRLWSPEPESSAEESRVEPESPPKDAEEPGSPESGSEPGTREELP